MYTPHRHIKNRHKNHKKNSSLVDFLIWIAIFAGIAVTIPQIYNVWILHDGKGVSPITWTGYSVLSLVWLSYGLFHKEKVIIISNSIWFFINLAIAFGAYLYN